MTNNNSQKSFRYAMINLSLVAAIVVTSFVMVFLRFYSEGLSVVSCYWFARLCHWHTIRHRIDLRFWRMERAALG